MDHFKLSDEFRQKLIESAQWGKAGVRLTEGSEVIEEGRRAESVEQEYLSEEVHVCPLCTSQLDESIDEERILEHLDVIMGLVDRLSHLQEGEENVEAVIDNTIAQILLQDEGVATLDEDEEVVEEE